MALPMPMAPAFGRLLLAILILFVLYLPTNGECVQCQFTSSDAEDCKVYGLIDDELIAWNKASTDCLEHYTISIATINPDSVGCGDPYNINSFVNGVKFESIPNSVRGGLGVAEGGFFVQENGVYVLKDEIIVNGNTIDCDVSESDCYNAMKEYFAVSPGAEEMEQVCDTVQNQVAVDRELEQSTVRNQICSDIKASTTPPTVCEPLASQVGAEMTAYPRKDCSGFQFGPGTTPIPGCEDLAEGSPNNATSGVLSHKCLNRVLLLPLLSAVVPLMA